MQNVLFEVSPQGVHGGCAAPWVGFWSIFMIWLFLCVICTTGWALSYKYSLSKGCHPAGMIPTVGASALVILFVAQGVLQGDLVFNGPAVALGAAVGMALYFAVLSYFYLIRAGARLGISWTIITLSMMLPVSVSVIVWKEFPSAVQFLGIACACVGIVLMGRVKEGSNRMTAREIVLLMTAFLMSGTTGVGIKVFASSDFNAYKPMFFIAIYTVVLMVGVFGMLIQKRTPSAKEMFLGSFMGASGVGNTIFLVVALESISGTVAFPTRSCGNLLLTIVASYFLWREKINKPEATGLVLALAAVVLLNL